MTSEKVIQLYILHILDILLPGGKFQIIKDSFYGMFFSSGAQRDNFSFNMTINANMCSVIYTVAVCNGKSKQ